MNKKKILSILLASVMGLSLCAGLTACGGGERNVELPAYTGDQYDSDGKILFNDEIFYRNDNKGISADPFVLDDTQEGRSGYYYAYSTSGVNFVYRSKDLAHWEGVRHAVDISGDAGNAIWSDIWAPEVIYDEEAEKYFMFFSATPRDSSAKYLMYLATSDKAEGPYKLVNFLDETSCENNGHDFDTSTYSAYFAKYVMFDPEDFATAVEEFGYGNLKGGSVEGTGYIQTIDPHPFVDPMAQPDGTHKKYLYFVGNDGSNVNFVVEMENWYTPKWDTLNTVLRYGYYTVEDYNKVKDGNSNVETVPYESQGINEGPTVYYNSTNNKYYLTYSTGDYKDNTYQVCQAVSDYPDKGFRKLTPDENGCFLSGGLQGSMEVSGTGHHGLITVGDKLYVIYHRHNDFNAAGELRNAGIDEIKWITVKDIENNTALCIGYSGELFVPYEYFVHFGLAEEGEKIDEVYVNPVLITAYGYDGTTTNDRNWYNTAGEDTDGNGWSNPSTFLHFNKNGLVSYDINTEITGKGNVSTQKGYDFALKDNSLTLNVTAENGYTLDTLTVNDVNYKDKLEYNDGVAQIFLPTVNADVNVKATFVETSATQRSVKGNIIPQGVNASKGVYDMEVSLFDGFNYNALRTINGSFAGNVPEGDYALVVLSKSEGYEITRQNIKVDKDLTDIVVNIDDTMYGDTAAIRFDGLSLGLGSKTVNLPKPVMSDKFVFTFRLGVGVDGASFPVDKYVEEISLQTESGAYIAFQLLRWNQPGETQGQFETKILLDGYDVQSQGLFSQDFTDLVLSQGYLDFALVRNDRVLTIYAKNANGEYEQLGTASLFSAIGDEPITTYRLSGAEGVTAQVGVKISECVIYQGTDDINIIKN